MKNFMVAFLILTTVCSYGQDVRVRPHKINNTLDVFEGNWIWSSGTDTLKLYLRKKEIFQSSSKGVESEDMIIGFHTYVKDSVIIENTALDLGAKNLGLGSIKGTNSKRRRALLKCALTNRTHDKFWHLKLKLTKNKIRLIWHLKNSKTPSQLPKDLVLIKS